MTLSFRPGGPRRDLPRLAARRVPEIIAVFWIIKLLTTAMGESTSDYLVHTLDPVFAVMLGALGLGIAMAIQLTARRYVAWIYWLAVLMVAVFGTMAADAVFFVLHVPYVASTMLFAVGLAVIFVLWYRTEGTLSIHSVRSLRRELFYWAAVMATFALGTAAGDMTATVLRLGYFTSGLLFTALIVVPAVAYWRFGMNEILAFWFAYILTRPIGASFADWMGRPAYLGGSGLGQARVSVVLGVLIVACVAYLTVSRTDVQVPGDEADPGEEPALEDAG